MFKSKLLNFPTFKNKNIKLYYILTIFMNGWFVLPNWVFYFAQYISIIQIGIIDGLSKLVAVVLEIPSGAISDLLGKKKILILGNLFFVFACLTLIYATDFLWLFIGNILSFIGFSLVSGSKEALLYDSLIDIKKEKNYDEILGKVNSLSILMTLIAIFIGGFVFKINPKLTFVLWLVYSIFAIITLLFMKEPKFDKQHTTFKEYFSILKTGVSSIFNKPFIKFVLPVLFFSMLIKSYEGVVRQSTGSYFGFTGETFGYLLAIISIPALVVSYNYHKIVEKLKDRIELAFLSLYAVGFLIVFLTNNLYFGMISFFSVYVAQEILKPYVLSLVNKNTESKHRATAISTISLFSEIPYMIIVIFFGYILEVENIKYLYLIFSMALGGYLVISKIGKRKKIGDTIIP